MLTDKDVIDFTPIKKDVDGEVDRLVKKKKPLKYDAEDRVRIAHEIKNNPPTPGFMRVDIPPGIYGIDLNTDAHWWFNHVCTVFPLLLDQGIRTHVDIKDSFKPEKRLPDFNYMWIIVLIIGLLGFLVGGSFLGIF